MSNNSKVKETHSLGDGVIYDTKVEIIGEFWVGGSQREEFKEKLADLIDEYRI